MVLFVRKPGSFLCIIMQVNITLTDYPSILSTYLQIILGIRVTWIPYESSIMEWQTIRTPVLESSYLCGKVHFPVRVCGFLTIPFDGIWGYSIIVIENERFSLSAIQFKHIVLLFLHNLIDSSTTSRVLLYRNAPEGRKGQMIPQIGKLVRPGRPSLEGFQNRNYSRVRWDLGDGL